MDGEVTAGGTLGAGADDFQSGCFGGEAVEEFVLAAASHDVEALEIFSGDRGYVAENFGVARGEAVEEKGCELGSVLRGGVEGRKIPPFELSVDVTHRICLDLPSRGST